MTVLDVSADLGLAAVFLITFNICLGLLMTARYSPYRQWPHRHINVFRLHRGTAYVAVTLVLAHPAVLLALRSPKFRLIDLLLPTNSPVQTTINTIGAIALYLVLIVLLSSLARLSIGRKLWKRLHYLNYPTAVMWFVHGLLTDTKLKNRPTDWLDAEKLSIEICFALIVAASAVAHIARRHRQHRDQVDKVGKYFVAQAVKRRQPCPYRRTL